MSIASRSRPAIRGSDRDTSQGVRIPVGRIGTPRSKTLCLQELRDDLERLASLTDGGMDLIRQFLRVDRHAGIDNDFGLEQSTFRRPRQYGRAITADQIGHRKRVCRHDDGFQVGWFRIAGQ